MSKAPKPGQLKIQTVSISKLDPSKYNPRVDLQPGEPEYEKLKRSIVEFGYVDPIIWNQHTGHVVGGHQRLKILIDLGHKEVPVSIINVKDLRREKELNIALNKISGDWDMTKLRAIFSEFKMDDEDLLLTGFDHDEITTIMSFDENSESPDLGLTPGQKKGTFDEGTIKQIVLYYGAEEYEDRISRIEKILDEKGLEDTSSLFDMLLDFYEAENSKDKK